MKQASGIDRYTKIILTLIVVLLVVLLCKPLLVAGPVAASYETTAEDAWYHADEAYYLAEKALKEAEEAYSYAGSAYYRAEEAYDKARVAEDNAYYYANKTESSAYQRMKRELSDLEEAFEVIAFFLGNNREDLIIIGEELGIAISSTEELRKEFEEEKEKQK